MDEEKNEGRGFRVTDRRRFAESGEPREDAPSAPAPEAAAAAPPVEEAPPPPKSDEPVNFPTFILGLSTQALLHMGEIEDPVTRRVERDLGAAKHVIDILGILREKTRNNLEQAEEALLDSILYDLRMRYVELVRRGVKEGT